MNTRDFLFQLKWDPFFQDQLQDIRIIVLNRGEKVGQKVIPFLTLKAIEGNFLVVPNEDEAEEEIRIPIHCIIQITNVKTEQIFYHRSVG